MTEVEEVEMAMTERERAAVAALQGAFAAQGLYPYPMSRFTASCVGPVDFGTGEVHVNWCPVGDHLWASREEQPQLPGTLPYEVPCPEHDGAMAPASESPEQGEGWKHMDAIADIYDEDDPGCLPPPFCGW